MDLIFSYSGVLAFGAGKSGLVCAPQTLLACPQMEANLKFFSYAAQSLYSYWLDPHICILVPEV